MRFNILSSMFFNKLTMRSIHTRDIFVNTQRVSKYYSKLDVSNLTSTVDSKNGPGELLKYILNDKIACLYYIDLGSFCDMSNKMNISSENYPMSKFENYRLGKFGLTKDISTRLKQHQNKKNGYGRWSSRLKLEWMIMISPSQLVKAEKTLSDLLESHNLKFSFVDCNNKRHDELIIFDQSKTTQVKNIYKQVLDLYPSKEDKIIQGYEDELLKKRYEYELKLRDEKEKTMRAQHRSDMLALQLRLTKAKKDDATPKV